MAKTFATAWLSGDPEATDLLPASMRDRAARAAAVQLAAQRPLDPALLAILQRQNAQLPPSPQREANLALLAQPGTVV